MNQNPGRRSGTTPAPTEPTVAERERFLAAVRRNASHLDHQHRAALGLVTAVDLVLMRIKTGDDVPEALTHEVQERINEWTRLRRSSHRPRNAR